MSDLVIKELKEIDKGIAEEREEKMLAKTVQFPAVDMQQIL